MRDEPIDDSLDFDRVCELFERALSLPIGERAGFVQQQAGDDEALAAAVLSMLADADVPSGPKAPGGGERVQSTATGELLEKLQHAPKLDEARYAPEHEIGKGGMGVVLRIHDRHLNRRLAMKVLLERPAPRADEERRLVSQLLGRFLEEAQVTSQLDHPGVVPVHELGLDQRGKVYFTMRLVKGRTASEVFHEARAGEQDWTVTRALEVILKVCDTMAYAHDKGVLHRDLKPQNVMVGKFGEVYVMDWGLAKVLGQQDRHDLRIRSDESTWISRIDSARWRDAEGDTGSSVVSMDGQQLGTPSYMSPEQARSEPLDPRADVYAIGAMMYELLTGRPPYTAPGVRPSPYRILNEVIDGPPKRIEDIEKGVPAELVAIVRTAMARDREQRYGRVLELAADLRAYIAQRVVTAYRTGALVEMRLWMRRNKPLAASLAAAVLILAGAVVLTTALANRMAALAVDESKAKEDALQQKQRADAKAEELEWSTYVANVQIAGKYLELRDVAQLRERLMACPERLRGWEWRWLRAVDDTSLLELKGHTLLVRAAAFSPDGTRVVTASDDFTARVWDATTGASLVELKRHAAAVTAVAFSPDGTRVMTASDDGSARVWDAASGASLAELKGHGGFVRAAAFSSDGTRVVTASFDMTARVWDAATGVCLAELNGHMLFVTGAAFSPDGTRIVTASWDSTARLGDATTGACLVELKERTQMVNSAVFSPDGNRVLTAADASARLWDRDGQLSITNRPFTNSIIHWIRTAHGISTVDERRPCEITVNEVAERLGVHHKTVRAWIKRKIVTTRRRTSASPYWVLITPEKETELRALLRDRTARSRPQGPGMAREQGGSAV